MPVSTVPESTEPSGSGVIDHLVLEKFREETGGDLNPFIEKFLVKLPHRIQAIADAVEKKNLPGVAKEAHRLKGTAGNIGAVRLVDVCRKLEQLGRVGNLRGCTALIPILHKTGRQVKEEIEQMVTS